MVDEQEQFQQDFLGSVRQMKAGKATRVTQVRLFVTAEARAKVSVSGSVFAKLSGVSLRTSQDWTQSSGQPIGPAQTLLRVVSQPLVASQDMYPASFLLQNLGASTAETTRLSASVGALFFVVCVC